MAKSNYYGPSYTRNVTKPSFFGSLLFQKQPASFNSAFALSESIGRLAAETKRWGFLTPCHESLVGCVNENKVSLHRVVPFVNNSFAPEFYGRFHVRDGVTVLEGYFVSSRDARIFMTFWFGFVLLMCVLVPLLAFGGVPIKTTPPMPQWKARLFMISIPYAMLLCGLLLVATGKWLARKDTLFISQKIQAALGANPIGN